MNWSKSSSSSPEKASTRDDVLQFLPDTEQWSLASHMVNTRGWHGHAASTINFDDVMSKMFAYMFEIFLDV